MRLPLPLLQSQNYQVLTESSRRLKGGCVEAETVGALVPRDHLGVFEDIQASLHLTCP